MSLKQRLSHGPAKYEPDLELAAERDRVIKADQALAGRLALLKASQNPNWIGAKMRPSCIGNRKNRPGRKEEHAEANIENAYHDALIENASRSLAKEIDKALNG